MTLGCLDDLPRIVMGRVPTPLERLERLGTAAGGAALWAKRDDLNDLAFGGNKVRQLAYYFGAAEAEGADTVLITGAVQSNYCRLAAAFAARLGLACHIQQEDRVAKDDPLYRQSGNVLIERLLGAHLHAYPRGEDEAGADANLEAIAEDLRRQGAKPYVIHLAPGHPPLGALGYIDAAREVVAQAAALGLTIDHAVVPSGSGATHAGFLFGLRALGAQFPVTGICVRRGAGLQKPRIEARCEEIAALLGIENPVRAADVVVDDRFLAPGYGVANPPTEEAIGLAARMEAMLLDPVYSGKAMAGAIDIARAEGPGRVVLFLHTGGTPALFAYGPALGSALAPTA
ncbi:MAG: D-cysteine desulfhydrase family protein [Pseudomonadota bacterium]